MKKFISKIFALTILIFTVFVQPAKAHPADLYAHTITINFTQTQIQIQWELKPGPLLVNFLWNEMDVDQDGTISKSESENWSASYLDLLTASVGESSLPLTVDSVQLPGTLSAFQSGTEFITFQYSADFDQTADDPLHITIKNGMGPAKSISWFYLSAEDGTVFLLPTQKYHVLIVDLIRRPGSGDDPSRLLTAWDSGAPALPAGQEKDAVTETAEQVVPELSERPPQEILLDLVRTPEISTSFIIFSLVIAAALGALHALTPGHGKTVVAAYLVGSRGTAIHAIVLGSVVTLTHTGSVFSLGLLTLTLSRYFFTPDLFPILEILSGLLILILGAGLLVPRLRDWLAARRQKDFAPAEIKLEDGKKRLVINQTIEESGPRHKHDGEIPKKPKVGDPLAELSWRSLVALGVSGGLVPCPDAVAILLVAVAINRILFGLTLILSFSFGLAVVLIVIGMVMVNGRRLFDRMEFMDRLAPVMPVISAVVVLALGAGLTWSAFLRAQENSTWGLSAQRSIDEARVLFLQEDENRIKHLFITSYAEKSALQLSEENQNVTDFIVAPDQTQAAYLVQNENTETELWLANLETLTRKKLTGCSNAICSGVVWSPDGARIMYERLSLEGNGSGLPTLWQVDAATGESGAVFQNEQIPGGNPRWSPDGKWMSYSTPEGIRLYRFEDGETRVIENILGAAAMWSPDGKSILLRDVVIEDAQFVTQLFLYDLDSETLVNISPDADFENTLAAWSPDGNFIAVVRRDLSVPRGDQIWLMNADGSNARALTADPDVLHGSLNWSPDGTFLLYEMYSLTDFPFSSHLQVLDVKSGEVHDLGLDGFNPKWVW